MYAWHHLVDFLATNLDEMMSLRQRRELVRDTDLDMMAPDLVFEGSARSFTQELLAKLHERGQAELVRFLTAVQANYPWSPEDSQRLSDFLTAIEANASQDWASWRRRLPRVYLAYQHDATEQRPIVANLIAALINDGYEVIELASAAQHDEHWRSRLLRGIGNCHGGIVLLDKEILAPAAPALEEFVQDVTLLRWRDWRDEDFILVPVVLATDSSLTILDSPPWQPLDIPASQPIRADDSATIITQLLARLAPLHERIPQPTWVEAVEKSLAAKLSGVSEVDVGRLEDTLQQLNGSLQNDKNNYTLERQVARALLSKGLPGMDPIIDRAAGEGLPPTELEKMLETLRSSWVDLRAAALIPRYAALPAAQRIFCVNGEYPDVVGRCYIEQACQDHRGLDYYWKVIEVTLDDIDAVIDQEIRPGLVNTFRSLRVQRQRLERRFRTDTSKINKELDNMINKKLVEWEKERTPVFVVFGPNQYDPVKLERIRTIYPPLTLFLLVGKKATTSPLPGVDMLVPLLPEDAEEKEQDLFYRLFDKIPG